MEGSSSESSQADSDLAAFIAVRAGVFLPSRRGNLEQEEVRLASSPGRDSSQEETQTQISGLRRKTGFSAEDQGSAESPGSNAAAQGRQSQPSQHRKQTHPDRWLPGRRSSGVTDARRGWCGSAKSRGRMSEAAEESGNPSFYSCGGGALPHPLPHPPPPKATEAAVTSPIPR